MTGSKYATLGHMASHTIRIDGVQARILEVARNRLLVAGIIFLLAFLVVGGRLVALAAFDGLAERTVAKRVTWSPGRGDVFDRNGVLLATSLPVASLIANPREILDPVETTNRLVRMFPELDRKTILRRLSADTLFAQIRRGLTPGQQQAVLNLGLPGLQFNIEPHRVYPLGRMASHLLGFTNRNADGVAGAESAFNKKLAAGQSVHLSVDIGVQGVVRQELLATMREFRAIGAAGIVLDARNGEVLAMVSLPDYDPNDPAAGDEEFRFNRVTQGVYEMGSTFKLFTAAMALETGTVTLRSGYDASHPIRKAGYTIRDFHAQKRWLSVPEIIVHSSNIGAAQMALDVGAALQRNYLTQFGLMTPSPIELPEVGKPQTPKQWRDISTMTIGFGHGISVSPLQLASGVATIVNGGMRLQPTVLRRDSEPVDGKRVLSERTSELMRAIMRMVVMSGTGRSADVPGLRVGGKTGTAEKLKGRHYSKNTNFASFVGAFPIGDPRYVVLVAADEPQGNARTGYRETGGWVAAPAVGRIIHRIAPILAVQPEMADIEEVHAKNVMDPRIRHAVLRRKTPVEEALHLALDQARGRPGAVN